MFIVSFIFYAELSSGLKVYKYSREKTQSWLRAKVEALGSGLEEEGVFVGAGSISSSLVRSSRQPTISKGSFLFASISLSYNNNKACGTTKLSVYSLKVIY